MLKSIIILAKDIEIGDILDEDIYEGETLLLRSGLVITSGIKRALQNRNTIRIKKEITGFVDENLKDDSIAVLDEQVKHRIESSIVGIFDNVECADETVSLANDISNTLVNDVLQKDGVGVNLESLKISDEYTFKHSVDVAAMSIALGKRLQLTDKDLKDLGTAGILHDIGKTKIPNEILNKNGSLSDDEFKIIQNHPVLGYQLLMTSSSLSETIRRGILYHHEKYCGHGYPSGLIGEQIPLFARIISVVDVFDALVTTRPYHQAYSVNDSLEIMYTMSSSFDIKIFKEFLSMMILYPVGSIVKLSTGQSCQVIKANLGYPLRPTVKDLDSGDVYDLANDPFCLSYLII